MVDFDGDIVSYIDDVINKAIDKMASDIHFEATSKVSLVRIRIDGTLIKLSSIPLRYHKEVIARIKILSDLDIAERRLPQDGRISIGEIDLRVAIVPAMNGESVVIRILNNDKVSLEFDELGLNKYVSENLKEMCLKSSGLILSTGPTGCGKTTTLYSLIKLLNKMDTNIMTIEDPVEYRLDGTQQIQVNTAVGMTFSRGLRSMLRSDPDIIMVGEIRDTETAEIAIRAAITGHLLFTSLHTLDSYSAIIRLIDMGIEPYLISSSVSGIQSQRLIKELCPYCKKSYSLTKREKDLLKTLTGSDDGEFMKAVGCEKCINGYKSRQVISEILIMDNDFIDLTKAKADLRTIRQVAKEKNIPNMLDDGLNKARNGQLLLADVLKATSIMGKAYEL